nr:MAG TPA: hypothetical protein [Caudoviricetes sp.]
MFTPLNLPTNVCILTIKYKIINVKHNLKIFL